MVSLELRVGALPDCFGRAFFGKQKLCNRCKVKNPPTLKSSGYSETWLRTGDAEA